MSGYFFRQMDISAIDIVLVTEQIVTANNLSIFSDPQTVNIIINTVN